MGNSGFYIDFSIVTGTVVAVAAFVLGAVSRILDGRLSQFENRLVQRLDEIYVRKEVFEMAMRALRNDPEEES